MHPGIGFEGGGGGGLSYAAQSLDRSPCNEKHRPGLRGGARRIEEIENVEQALQHGFGYDSAQLIA
jgi:hypothetical protein